MKQYSIKPIRMVLFSLLLASFLAVPLARGAVTSTRMTFAPDVVEERVDCLITYLKQNKDIEVPDDFKAASGLQKELSRIGKPGIVVQGKDADRALNKAAKELLDKLLSQLAQANPYRNIVVALLDSVDELPEGFCQPEAYETGKDLRVDGRDLYEERNHYKDPPAESGNFIYYGKEYTLPDEASVAPNGILCMSDDPFRFTASASDDPLAGLRYPPFIAPLWLIPFDDGLSLDPDGEGASLSVAQAFDPPNVTGTRDFFRYAYEYTYNEDLSPSVTFAREMQERLPRKIPFSVTLYTNPASRASDWILFSYGDDGKGGFPLSGQYVTFVGLVPGDGSKNHPGPSVARGFAWRSSYPSPFYGINLSEEKGEGLDDSGGKYLSIFQIFPGNGAGDQAKSMKVKTARTCVQEPDLTFDLANHFLIFRPDGANKYTVTDGTRKMVVDSLGLDGRKTSLDTAIINLRDPDLLARVDDEEFVAGPPFPPTHGSDDAFPGIEDWPIRWDFKYKYGIQTVGQNCKWGSPKVFTRWDTLNKINGNGLLAYAVQVEEDRVNKKIIEMARDRDKMKLRVDTIKNQLQCGDIRARDALFTQEADAQSGRVTRDRNGNWVRSQQYILRPDNQTVQVLNVSLRGQDAGNLAGLSTMDFTTTFKEGYDGDLRSLPWGGWLGTIRSNDGRKQILTTWHAPTLDNMYVKFTNPSGESLQESRWFGDKAYCVIHQFVMGEELELSSLKNGKHTYGYHYTGHNVDDPDVPELYPLGKELLPEGSYTVENIKGAGFNYTFAGDPSINVSFFKVDDYGDGPVKSVDLADIWDALRVNESWGSPNIGNNNLEIAIDREANYFDKPIDVVYIPMSRMLWKTREGNEPD